MQSVIRYAIANIDPSAVASMGQEAGLNGTVMHGVGFGNYGIEPVSVLEIAGDDETVAKADKFVRKILFNSSEHYAYRTVNGKDAGLLSVVNGKVVALEDYSTGGSNVKTSFDSW